MSTFASANSMIDFTQSFYNDTDEIKLRAYASTCKRMRARKCRAKRSRNTVARLF